MEGRILKGIAKSYGISGKVVDHLKGKDKKLGKEEKKHVVEDFNLVAEAMIDSGKTPKEIAEWLNQDKLTPLSEPVVQAPQVSQKDQDEESEPEKVLPKISGAKDVKSDSERERKLTKKQKRAQEAEFKRLKDAQIDEALEAWEKEPWKPLPHELFIRYGHGGGEIIAEYQQRHYQAMNEYAKEHQEQLAEVHGVKIDGKNFSVQYFPPSDDEEEEDKQVEEKEQAFEKLHSKMKPVVFVASTDKDLQSEVKQEQTTNGGSPKKDTTEAQYGDLEKETPVPADNKNIAAEIKKELAKAAKYAAIQEKLRKTTASITKKKDEIKQAVKQKVQEQAEKVIPAIHSMGAEKKTKPEDKPEGRTAALIMQGLKSGTARAVTLIEMLNHNHTIPDKAKVDLKVKDFAGFNYGSYKGPIKFKNGQFKETNVIEEFESTKVAVRLKVDGTEHCLYMHGNKITMGEVPWPLKAKEILTKPKNWFKLLNKNLWIITVLFAVFQAIIISLMGKPRMKIYANGVVFDTWWDLFSFLYVGNDKVTSTRMDSQQLISASLPFIKDHGTKKRLQGVLLGHAIGFSLVSFTKFILRCKFLLVTPIAFRRDGITIPESERDVNENLDFDSVNLHVPFFSFRWKKKEEVKEEKEKETPIVEAHRRGKDKHTKQRKGKKKTSHRRKQEWDYNKIKDSDLVIFWDPDDYDADGQPIVHSMRYSGMKAAGLRLSEQDVIFIQRDGANHSPHHFYKQHRESISALAENDTSSSSSSSSDDEKEEALAPTLGMPQKKKKEEKESVTIDRQVAKRKEQREVSNPMKNCYHGIDCTWKKCKFLHSNGRKIDNKESKEEEEEVKPSKQILKKTYVQVAKEAQYKESAQKGSFAFNLEQLSKTIIPVGLPDGDDSVKKDIQNAFIYQGKIYSTHHVLDQLQESRPWLVMGNERYDVKDIKQCTDVHTSKKVDALVAGWKSGYRDTYSHNLREPLPGMNVILFGRYATDADPQVAFRGTPGRIEAVRDGIVYHSCTTKERACGSILFDSETGDPLAMHNIGHGSGVSRVPNQAIQLSRIVRKN